MLLSQYEDVGNISNYQTLCIVGLYGYLVGFLINDCEEPP